MNYFLQWLQRYKKFVLSFNSVDLYFINFLNFFEWIALSTLKSNLFKFLCYP